MDVVLVMTNASPSDWTNLPCQGVKLVSKRHLVAALQHGLPLSNHVHQFDAIQAGRIRLVADFGAVT